MAYPGSHMLTVFGGSLYGTEQWSVGVRSTPNFGDPTEVDEGAVTDVAEAIRAWFQAQTILSVDAKLGFVKHNRIGTNGRYTNSITGLVEYEPEQGGGATNVKYPPQCAVVASLETGFTRGLASRGRIYLPIPAQTLGADGRMSANGATLISTSVAGLLTTLNGVAQFGTVSIYSDVREGASRPVTSVRVGRTIDTMRSRRAQLLEEYPPAVTVGGT